MNASRPTFSSVLLPVLLTLCSASLAGAARPEDAPARRFALIVAVRDYPSSRELLPLDGTNRDAERLRRVLVRSGFDSGGVELIYDDADSPQHRPTRENILAALDRTLAHTSPKDEVLVVVTSHGIAFGNQSYLCPADVTDAALDGRAIEQLLPVSALTDRLSDAKAEKKLLVIDACRDVSRDHSKGFIRTLEKPPVGLWVLSSCSEGESSYQTAGLREGEVHAIFLYYLCEALEGKADLLGNYDGAVSVSELQAYTSVKAREAAWRLERRRQTPELFGGLARMYHVTDIPGYVPVKSIVTADPKAERRNAGSLLADAGIKRVRAAEAGYVERFVSLTRRRYSEETVQSLHQDYHHQLCYALGNYLTPAVALDGNSKLAHLGRGMVFRTCGLYDVALREFELAGEHFDLFVRADPASLDPYFERRKNGSTLAPPRDADKKGDAVRHAVPRQHPSAQAPPAGRISSHSKVRIGGVETADGGLWLRVTAVNDVPLDKGGWLHQRDVVWFKEAVDLYTPDTPMMRVGGGLPPALSRIETASYRLYALADRLEGPRRRIQQVARAVNNVDRVLDIGRRFGAPIPSIAAPLNQAASWAGLPADYVRTAAGAVQVPAAYARSVGSVVGYASAYRSGLQRSQVSDEQREALRRAATLQPVRERPILISLSPWSQTEG